MSHGCEFQNVNLRRYYFVLWDFICFFNAHQISSPARDVNWARPPRLSSAVHAGQHALAWHSMAHSHLGRAGPGCRGLWHSTDRYGLTQRNPSEKLPLDENPGTKKPQNPIWFSFQNAIGDLNWPWDPPRRLES